MSAQHTAGPWQAVGSHPSEGFDCFWIKAKPSPVARGFTKEIGCVNGPQGSKQVAADARLIAAAPELLELAYQYQSDLRHPPTAESVERRLERIAAVLAKVGVA